MLQENARSSLKINYFFPTIRYENIINHHKNSLAFFKKDAFSIYFDAYYNLLHIKHLIKHTVEKN